MAIAAAVAMVRAVAMAAAVAMLEAEAVVLDGAYVCAREGVVELRCRYWSGFFYSPPRFPG